MATHCEPPPLLAAITPLTEKDSPDMTGDIKSPNAFLVHVVWFQQSKKDTSIRQPERNVWR